MIPITRKELYLNKIVGNDDYDTPEKPISEEEFFFAEILGEAVQAPAPLTRYQMYLAKIAGRNIEIPTPITRLEYFLARAAGMDVETPTPITREEIFWSNYSAIVDFEVEGVPPLTYKAIEGTLENYRIYGNTVNGESVGDRTGNLWDEDYENIPQHSPLYKPLYVGDGEFTLSTTAPLNLNKAANIFMIAGNVTTGASTATTGVWFEHPHTVSAVDGYITIALRYQGGVNPIDYKTMLNFGSTTLPYEPYGYKVPVTVSNGTDTLTTPIYLPEPIKMVGDEAEYIDYREQKMHKVRKNLFPVVATSKTVTGVTFTVNADKSVTCNGTNNGTSSVIFEFNPSGVSLEIGESYIVTGCPEGGKMSGGYTIQYNNGSSWSYEIGHGATFTALGTGIARPRILISRGVTVNNLTFYPMIRKANIEDDTYEPYIENTDLNVTLPALPTLSGTNTLSVGTTVQPSKVYIKGEKRRD